MPAPSGLAAPAAYTAMVEDPGADGGFRSDPRVYDDPAIFAADMARICAAAGVSLGP